jgi:type I restriction enzyme S subunit
MSAVNNIPNGWVETTLGEVVERITKGTTPKIFSSNTEDVNYVKSDSLNYGGILDKSKFVKITNEINEELKRSQLKTDDILVSMAGEYLGKTGLVKEEHLPANTNQAVAIITVNKNLVDHLFIWYKLRDLSTVKYFNSIPSQSAQPNINFQEIRSLSIYCPPILEQKFIAAILTAFDDKIELLQAQNKTIEETAQTIFKEWFGKYQIGDELPEGWRVGKIGDIVDFVIDNRGKTPPIVDFDINNFPVIEVNSITGNNRSINIRDARKYVDKYNYDNWFRKGHPINGDVLISTVGSIGQLGQVFEEKICIAQNIVALRNCISGNYLYELLKFYQESIKNLDISSVQPSIKVPHLLNLDIIIPSELMIRKFDSAIKGLTKKISENQSQIQTLTQTRDELLPKLMSGEIRVNEFNQ